MIVNTSVSAATPKAELKEVLALEGFVKRENCHLEIDGETSIHRLTLAG